MLRAYAKAHNGVLDSIYDRNVRKWLGKRTRSVNAGIAKTLLEQPERFVAYNNGITIVCRGFVRTSTGLQLDSLQIVNGCQTTRTLFDFMENEFAGIAEQLQQHEHAGRYRTALLPFKVIAVENLDDNLVKEITRYSNRQNAVRGRDFLTLEDDFHRLKGELGQRGYFLEVQTGEYYVLPKADRERFPNGLINAFDALRFYGATVLAKPHTAFGHSSDFTPGGREFGDITVTLTTDDLYVPWLVSEDARKLRYSVGVKLQTVGDDHRNQTRYFFAYVLFRLASEVLRGSPRIDVANRQELYSQLMRLREHGRASDASAGIYQRLLNLSDGTVAVYMALAKEHRWYADRNAFLKSVDLLSEDHLLLASSAALLEKSKLRDEARTVSAS